MSALRLIGLTALTMLAFAANSILNRMALSAGLIDPVGFAVIRVLSGAGILVAIVLLRGHAVPVLARGRPAGVASLCLYLVGFSVAYIYLDAGLGALILFGLVQITMFAGAALMGEAVARRRWIGMGVALAGLTWLLWPAGAVQVPVIGAVAMGLAGIGWGIYSLVGRRAGDPLAATAANFLLAAPIIAGLPFVLPVQLDPTPIRLGGVGLAVLSGAVTSGLGYALWYSVLPRLAASVAGLVQLSVPVIAVLAGALLLGEGAGVRTIGAGAVVLGGIAIGLWAGGQRRMGSSGS